jgi:DNA-binding CsgD family transcriptional regulator
MAKPSTFRVLMVWIDGEEAFADERLDEELLPEHITALGAAGAARRKGFLLLARRNWELEYQARLVRMPQEIRGLFELPDREAVRRLVGSWDNHDHYRPGLAGLTEIEARVLDLRIVDRRSTAEVGWALDVRDKTVRNHLAEARRKIRTWFYPPQLVISSSPSGAAPALPDGRRTDSYSGAIKNGTNSQLCCALQLP